MNKSETTKLLTIIAVAWPSFEVTEARVEVWHDLLLDLDYPAADAAVRQHLATSEFPPTIAGIRKQATREAVPDEGEAWGQALASVRQFGYYAKVEALAAMDPVVAHTVERFGWDEFCKAEADGVTMGLFMRMYRGISEGAKHQSLLPERLRTPQLGRGGDLTRIGAGHD